MFNARLSVQTTVGSWQKSNDLGGGGWGWGGVGLGHCKSQQWQMLHECSALPVDAI